MSNGQRTQVLMLGWEYPPHISGGLGTACEGLTTALSHLSVDIDFVVPHLYGSEHAPHMRLWSPEGARAAFEQAEGLGSGSRALSLTGGSEVRANTAPDLSASAPPPVQIPPLLSPYLSPEQYQQIVGEIEERSGRLETAYYDALDPLPLVRGEHTLSGQHEHRGAHYGRDLFQEVARYASRVVAAMRQRRPDVIHAHDWMTFPAAVQLARLHRVPLVVHVHSLEQDRSGGGANQTISAIEAAGTTAANRVIAVSHYTARRIHELHGIPLDKIDVVHNGVYARRTVNAYQTEHPSQGPLVLFLGRITYQKGPDYFVEAAVQVREKVPNARFVMAGSGDMLPRMKERVQELGMEACFEFPGFVRGDEVEYLYSMADVYVMPSVSEPFGISALEAMSCETPVILSRQSGAAEVLQHALKVDFWDINKLAAQIVAVLQYPELRRSIVDMAREEVRRIHWEASATKVKRVYQRALEES